MRLRIQRPDPVVLLPALLMAVLGAVLLNRTSLWLDEVATWTSAELSAGRLVTALHHQDVVFSLYYAFMWVWVRIGGGSAAWLRLPSLVAAVLAVVVLMRLTRREAGRSAALITGLALACNPFVLRYATEARVYAIEMLFLVLASAALLTALRACADKVPARGHWIRYSVWCLLAVYAHLFAVTFIAAHVLFVLISYGWRRAAVLLAWLVPVTVLTVPLAIAASSQSSQVSWIGQATPHELLLSVEDLAGGHRLALAVVVAVLVLLAVGLRTRRWPKLWTLGLLWAAVPVLALQAYSKVASPSYLTRYLLPVACGVAVVLGCAGAAAASWLQGRIARIVLLAAAVAVVFALAAIPLRHLVHMRERGSNFPAVLKYLNAKSRTGDEVLLEHWEYGAGIAYYAHDPALREAVLRFRTDHGSGVSTYLVWGRRPLRLIPTALGPDPSGVWVLGLVPPQALPACAPGQVSTAGKVTGRHWGIEITHYRCRPVGESSNERGLRSESTASLGVRVFRRTPQRR